MSPIKSSLAGYGMCVCVALLNVAGTCRAQDTAGDLSAAKARVAQMQQELQKAQEALKQAEQKAASTAGNENPPSSPGGAIEDDLMAEVGRLRRSLGQLIPAAHLRETTVKRPRQVPNTSTYDSEICFNVADQAGRGTKLFYKVQSGPDGRWEMPDVAAVQRQVIAFINRSAAQAVMSGSGDPHQAAALPVPAAQQKPPQSPPPPTGRPGTNTVVIGWGSAAPGAAPQIQPQPPAPLPHGSEPGSQEKAVLPQAILSLMQQNGSQPQTGATAPQSSAPLAQEAVPLPQESAPAPQTNAAPSSPVPPAPVAPTTPAPMPVRTPQPPAAPAPKRVPPPVMPVREDVQVRFE